MSCFAIFTINFAIAIATWFIMDLASKHNDKK